MEQLVFIDLCVKWGWFDGENPKATRKALKKVKWALNCIFLSIRFCFT
jgi:fumarate reductase subunit C